MQDLRYTYDPAGNITRIADDALPVIAHANQQVVPVCTYTYDAIYRLIEAKGREHIGQTAFAFDPPNGNFRDYPFAGLGANPNDLQALRNYTEQYEYDAVGNFEKLIHQAANGNWTRAYEYDAASLIEPAKQSNRLSGTTIGQTTEAYAYDAHGNMTTMPQLTLVQWDFEDQLRATSRQAVNDGTPETTFYVYDASGQRVRKVAGRQNGMRKSERIYLGGFEIYREYNGNGAAMTLERETLHVMDDKQRIALVETKTVENANPLNAPMPVQRYQLGNHLGSASLELNQDGGLISYEEFHPYGTTAYQAMNSAAEVSLKRYRYTGKERDEETGLYYHGARYYAPWLGRWASCDPLGIMEGVCLYKYVRDNPITIVDPDGKEGFWSYAEKARDAVKGAATTVLQHTPVIAAAKQLQEYGEAIIGAESVKDVPERLVKASPYGKVAGALSTEYKKLGARGTASEGAFLATNKVFNPVTRGVLEGKKAGEALERNDYPAFGEHAANAANELGNFALVVVGAASATRARPSPVTAEAPVAPAAPKPAAAAPKSAPVTPSAKALAEKLAEPLELEGKGRSLEHSPIEVLVVEGLPPTAATPGKPVFKALKESGVAEQLGVELLEPQAKRLYIVSGGVTVYPARPVTVHGGDILRMDLIKKRGAAAGEAIGETYSKGVAICPECEYGWDVIPGIRPVNPK